VFENRVLRRLFGQKRDEVTGEWRKQHNEELHSLYSSHSIMRMIKSRRMRRGRHVARMRANMNAYKILVGKLEGKRPPGRPGCRWVGNIKMDLRHIEWDDMNFIDLAQDRKNWMDFVNTVLNPRVP
jgi:predicted membrane protein